MMPTNTPPIDLPHKAYMLPNAIPMWPPVWWAWLVLAAIIVLLIAVSFALLRKRQNKAYRREALRSLTIGMEEYDDKALITHCHELIRRCLISEHKQSLASLPSQSLMDKLDTSLPKKKRFEQLGDIFISGPYRKDIDLTSEQKNQMINLTRYWIRKHRV